MAPLTYLMMDTALNDYNIYPMESLAFAMHSQRGTYALLLGSGISTSAGIPTGWNIMLDLIKDLADMRGVEGIDKNNAEKWFCDNFGENKLTYSGILSSGSWTPTERQQILRKYFENGDMQSTKAHKAIAELVRKGFVRVIITTNFDHLLEDAMKGVKPLVIKSDSDIAGMVPLVHYKKRDRDHCIIKVNGDYKDTNLRNIKSELSKYSPAMHKLLERVFDEFGLIVCGWSAEWDEGLRNLILATKGRRYTTYWAKYGELAGDAKRVIKQRDAQIIRIEDADSFFQRLREHLQSLDDISRPHPLSTNMAVAELKRYLPEEKHLIKMDDLLQSAVKMAEAAISEIALNSPAPTADTVLQRCGQYATTMSQLMSLAVVGAQWEKPCHRDIWKKILSRLSITRGESCSYEIWKVMIRFSGTLLLYALGMGAISAGNLEFLGHILRARGTSMVGEEHYLSWLLAPVRIMAYQPQKVRGRGYTPVNDWVFDILQKYMGGCFADERKYGTAFDRLEIFIALNYIDFYPDHRAEYRNGSDGPWAPSGRYIWRGHDSGNDYFSSTIDAMGEAIAAEKNGHKMVQANIFGSNHIKCLDNIGKFKLYVEEARWRRGICYS